MNAAIIWKEYRQLRGVWLVVTLLTILVLEGLLATVGSTTSWLDHINASRNVLFFIVVSGSAAHGIVVGAMLLARDKEDGTEALLDSLTGQRAPLWWSKMAIGLILVSLQGLVFVTVLLGHGASSLAESAFLPVLGVTALVWGVLGGAICRHVLSATLLATVSMTFSWLLAVPFGGVPFVLLVAEAVFTLAAFLVAQSIYCRSDELRLPETQRYAWIRFAIRLGAVALVSVIAVIGLLFLTYKMSVPLFLSKHFWIAMEIVGSFLILFALRRRLVSWQLMILAAGLGAMVCISITHMSVMSADRIPLLMYAVELSACLCALMLSRLAPKSIARASDRPSTLRSFVGFWQPLFWLVSRQGRWIFPGTAFLAILLGITARFAPLFIWPIGSLVVGMVCGLATFCPDQREGRSFWAAQRLPAGKIWIAKVAIWAGLLIATLGVAWVGEIWWSLREGVVTYYPLAWLSRWQGVHDSNSWFEINRQLHPILFLILWPIYGFSIALILGQLSHRPVLALIVSIFITPTLVAIWIPSFLIGGLPVWQVVFVPSLILLLSATLQQAWIAERLLTFKCIALTLAAIVVATGWVVGCLWHRVTEVPDVGEPFDVQAFLKELPPPENKAGELLPSILARLSGELDAIDSKFPGPQDENREGNFPDGTQSMDSLYELQVEQFEPGVWKRWGKVVGPRLDLLFTDKWYVELQEASAMPLGLIQDVRKNRSAFSARQFVSIEGSFGNLVDWRVAQLTINRDYLGAMQVMETALGIARQLENFAPSESYTHGVKLELLVLTSSLDRWLQAAAGNRKLLELAQKMIRKHAVLRPNPEGAVKTQIIINRSREAFADSSNSILDATYRRLAVQVPWEKARQQRVERAAAYGALSALRFARGADQVLAREQKMLNPADEACLRMAQSAELPPRNGVGAEVSAEEWGAFVFQSWPVFSNYELMVRDARIGEDATKAAQIAIAARRYLIEERSIPKSPKDLVPKYLPELLMHTLGGNGSVEWVETESIAGPCQVAWLVANSSQSAQTFTHLAATIGFDLAIRPSELFQPMGRQGMGMETPASAFAAEATDDGSNLRGLMLVAPRPIVQFGSCSLGSRNSTMAPGNIR